MMTRVKICGVTRWDDLEAAVNFGASAVGLVLEPKSPRFVRQDNEMFKRKHHVPPFVTMVAVFQRVPKFLLPPQLSFFDVLQSEEGKLPVIVSVGGGPPKAHVRALRLDAEATVDELLEIQRVASAFLLDTFVPNWDHSSVPLNWEVAAEFVQACRLPVILAGGLTPDTVGEAIRKVKPYAVDVCEGVESAPGVKDHGKLRAFMEAVREADNDIWRLSSSAELPHAA